MNVRLYIWQRLTAAFLAPMVLVHIAVIFYAMHRGLTAHDVLARTHGSVTWGLFYGAFVIAAAVHGSIGLRNVLAEWLPMTGRAAGVTAIVFGACLIVLGFRAVAAVVLL